METLTCPYCSNLFQIANQNSKNNVVNISAECHDFWVLWLPNPLPVKNEDMALYFSMNAGTLVENNLSEC
jgi:hypothetical protein